MPRSAAPSGRGLRSDAARNAARILQAARRTFAEQGPQASVEAVAREAGVGLATVYRRFPHRETLIRAVMEQCLRDEVDPAVERACDTDDPWQGLVAILDAALAMASRERNTLVAANQIAGVTSDISNHFLEPVTTLIQRGQAQGVVRADLADVDIPPIVLMLVSVLWAFEPDSTGWRRYCALLLDGLRPHGSVLPPPQPCSGEKDGPCRSNTNAHN